MPREKCIRIRKEQKEETIISEEGAFREAHREEESCQVLQISIMEKDIF